MATDMRKPERVCVAEYDVEPEFFSDVRVAAQDGAAFVQEVRGAGVKEIKRLVEERMSHLGAEAPEHLRIALHAAFLNSFASRYLERYPTGKKESTRLIAYAIRGQRYLVKTFCTLRRDHIDAFRSAAEIDRLAATGTIGAWTLAVVVRKLQTYDDLIVWFPSTHEDMFGIDLVVTHVKTMRGAYLQVKTSNSGETYVIRDATGAWDVGGQALLVIFERWMERQHEFVSRHYEVTWFPFLVLSGEERTEELEKLSVLPIALRSARNATTPT